MKIVSWNCNGALRKKMTITDSLNADILLIQECENPRESTKDYQNWAGEYLWIGTSKHKGIGVFPKNGNKVKHLDWSGIFRIDGLFSKSKSLQWKTADLKLFLPFSVNDKLTILGVWTKGSDDEIFGYMGQFWKYLQIHREDLSKSNTLILGDFNSNAIWDKNDRWWSHSDVISELINIDIFSVYHNQYKESQGKESIPTYFHQRNKEKNYHIDYAFSSKNILNKCTIEIGHQDDWLLVSDHMPIVIEIS